MDEATRPSGAQLDWDAVQRLGWGRPDGTLFAGLGGGWWCDVGSIGISVEVWTLHTEAGCDIGTQWMNLPGQAGIPL